MSNLQLKVNPLREISPTSLFYLAVSGQALHRGSQAGAAMPVRRTLPA